MNRRDFIAMAAVALANPDVARPVQQPERATNIDTSVRSWVARLPKVELHLHVEGAIPKAALWQLVAKYGGDASVPTFEAFERRFEYRGLTSFFQTFDWATSFVREPDDFVFVAREVARDLVRQNIRYVEAHFSPTVFRRRLTPQPIAQALRKGLDAVSGVEVRLIAELGRNLGPDGAMRTLEQVAELRDLQVIGVGLGGFEPQYPNELFSAVYERAQSLGFRTTAHAGESAGPASIWSAIRALRVDRIGHGTRAVEDPALVRYLAAQRIPVELCPLSNVRTNLVPSIARHPLRQFFEAGIPVSLNTDDPLFFGNTLVDELVAAHDIHGFTRDEVKRCIVTAVETSWLDADAKAALVKELRSQTAWNDVA